MGENAESLLGQISVHARLAIGSERISLFLTTNRIIVAHIGKRGAGALATTTFLGRLSGAFEDLFKSGRESLEQRSLRQSKPQEILYANKDNFEITHDEVVRVDLDEIPPLTIIGVLTRDNKFEFLTTLDFDDVATMLEQALGSKVNVKGINR